jgi:hypothetical protein
MCVYYVCGLTACWHGSCCGCCCQVLYFKYAGDNMETPDGRKFIVLREDDILTRLAA